MRAGRDCTALERSTAMTAHSPHCASGTTRRAGRRSPPLLGVGGPVRTRPHPMSARMPLAPVTYPLTGDIPALPTVQVCQAGHLAGQETNIGQSRPGARESPQGDASCRALCTSRFPRTIDQPILVFCCLHIRTSAPSPHLQSGPSTPTASGPHASASPAHTAATRCPGSIPTHRTPGTDSRSRRWRRVECGVVRRHRVAAPNRVYQGRWAA